MTSPTDAQIRSFLAHHGRDLPGFNWRWVLLVTVNALIWAMVLTAPRACG